MDEIYFENYVKCKFIKDQLVNPLKERFTGRKAFFNLIKRIFLKRVIAYYESIGMEVILI